MKLRFLPAALLVGLTVALSFVHADDVTAPADSSTKAERSEITKRLSSIIIDKLNFDRLDPKSFATYITKKSKALDPEHHGVHVICRLIGPAPVLPIQNGPIHVMGLFHIENAPLHDVLECYCQFANGYFHNSKAHYQVERDSVVLMISTVPDPKP